MNFIDATAAPVAGREGVDSENRFVAVAPIGEVPSHRPLRASVGGRAICLLRDSAGEIIAFEDRCPHRGHPLSEGICADGVLRCALHGWEFAVPGGEAVSPRAPFGLQLLATRLRDGIVEVEQ
jgi:phenylpropionate dioxygenase-like ring-hydroxylating dioxygenase large terminal subunit